MTPLLRNAITLGLSPRVRGNPGEAQQFYINDRSIPACAGEPIGQNPHGVLRRVYPRVCGGTCV